MSNNKERTKALKAAKSLRNAANAMGEYINSSSFPVNSADDGRKRLISDMDEFAGFLEDRFEVEA